MHGHLSHDLQFLSVTDMNIGCKRVMKICFVNAKVININKSRNNYSKIC